MKINKLRKHIIGTVPFPLKRKEVESSKNREDFQNLNKDTDMLSVLKKDEGSSPITYSGHGMIEVYPENLSMSYVVAHEMRHAQHNRMKSFNTGETLRQEIKYNISSKNGKLFAKGAVTESEFKNKDNLNGNSIYSLKSEEITELASLGKNKKGLKKELQLLEKKGVISESDKSQFIKSAEIMRLKQKIEMIDKKILSLESGKIKKRILTGAKKKDNIRYRDISDIVKNSFNFVKRKVPNISLLDGASSAFRADESLKQLEALDSSHPIERGIDLDSGFLQQKIDAWSGLRSRLSDLQNSINELKSSQNFNIHIPSSSDNEKFTAITQIDTSDRTHSISITQISLPHKVVSDIQSDPYSSLNITADIKINGYGISIKSSDSLQNIIDKINFGEDINNNGALDLMEDLNGNGLLDIIQIGEGENMVLRFEDIDADRTLDPSEDLNNNLRIDGGKSQLGVFAQIENNQLILTSLNGGRIELIDDNDALVSIGVFENNAHNQTVLKHNKTLSQTYTILNQEPQNAKINVDGIDIEKNSNILSDAIPKVTLNLKASSDNKLTLKIKPDITKTFSIVKKFINSFNRTIKYLNNQLKFKKTMKKDSGTQRIRTNLLQNTTKVVKGASDKIKNISNAGINIVKVEKNNYNELSITNLLKELKTGLNSIVLIPFKGSNSIFSNLGDLGIMTKEDDTLNIDNDKLKRNLAKNPVKIFNLFSNKTDGIVTRLDKQLKKNLNLNQGTVSLQQAVLSTKLNNPSAYKIIKENFGKIESGVQKKINNAGLISEKV